MDKKDSPKFCLLLAKEPLLGFWVAIKQKPLPFFTGSKGKPGILSITPVSKAASILCKTSGDDKFISSNNITFPSLKAFLNAPSWGEIPAKESLSPTYFPNKSAGFTSELILKR